MIFEYSAGAFIYRKRNGRSLFLVLTKTNGEMDLAKGHIEKGETAEQAAEREIFEETGMRPHLAPGFSASTTYFFMKNGEKVHKGVKFFIAKADSGTVRISKEHTGYRWMSYDEMFERVRYKDLREIMPRVNEYIGRMERMEALNEEYERLPKSIKGWNLSDAHVPGEGRLDANVMLIGQAPGQKEDASGRPFVGMSGKLLDRLLRKNGIKRCDIYITSIVQFFPPKNRAPNRHEIALCRPFLLRQIAIIRPKYVVLMGNVPSGGLLGVSHVESHHGKIMERDGIKYMITIHPAAAVRIKKKLPIIEADFEKLGKLLETD